MPVEKVGRRNSSRDEMIGHLLGGAPGVDSAGEAVALPSAPTQESEPVEQQKPAPAKEASPEPAKADATPPPEPEPKESEARKPEPAKADATPPPPVPQSDPVMSGDAFADPRLRYVPAKADRDEGTVQFANRIKVDLKRRLDRHKARTGESYGAFLERMLDLGLEISEAEAGVDKEGRPLHDEADS
jgi:hypothetical protein